MNGARAGLLRAKTGRPMLSGRGFAAGRAHAPGPRVHLAGFGEIDPGLTDEQAAPLARYPVALHQETV